MNSPVISARAAWASRNSSAKSSGRPTTAPAAASLSRARTSAATWRSRAMKVPAPASRQPAASSSLLRSRSMPSPVRADRWIACPLSRAVRPARSILLWTTTRTSFSGRLATIDSSAAVTPLRASTSSSSTSARSISLQVRAMPMRSTSSSVSRSPAVSTTTIGTPSIWMPWRTASRVVPAIGVTMASSSPARRLSRLDLPTFGWPARTTWMPLRRRLPCRAPASASASAAVTSASRRAASSRSAGSISSSGKSSVASTSMRSSTRLSATRCTRAENSPCSERSAERAAASVEASIRSATLSAWARSRRLLRNARRVNSPGSAGRAPSSTQRASTIESTTGPPWPCSSSTSSPVYERGAGK